LVRLPIFPMRPGGEVDHSAALFRCDPRPRR
jgi:hypothetical protein